MNMMHISEYDQLYTRLDTREGEKELIQISKEEGLRRSGIKLMSHLMKE